MIQVSEFRNIIELREYMEQSKGLFLDVKPVEKQFQDKQNGKLISTINYVLIEKV